MAKQIVKKVTCKGTFRNHDKIIQNKRLLPGCTFQVDTFSSRILSVKKGKKIIRLNHHVLDKNKRKGLIILFHPPYIFKDNYVCVVFEDKKNTVSFLGIDDLEPVAEK